MTIKVRLLLRRSFVILFLGPDGVGKTTMLECVEGDYVIKKTFKSVYSFHTSFSILPPMRKIAHKLGLFSEKKAEVLSGGIKIDKPNSFAKSTINCIYYGINNFLAHFWLDKKAVNGGVLVLLDRYYYEFLVQKEHVKAPRWLVKLFLKIIPHPDMVVLLKNDPSKIYERKQDLSIEEIERQLRVYDEISDRFSKKIVIDTSVPVSANSPVLISAVINSFLEKQ